MDKPAAEEFFLKAETIYAGRLRPILKSAHTDEFVVTEPEPGDYFLGKTLNEAAQAVQKRLAKKWRAKK